jgi:hypothetical protein
MSMAAGRGPLPVCRIVEVVRWWKGLVSGAVLVIGTALAPSAASAQDLEPRAYSNRRSA